MMVPYPDDPLSQYIYMYYTYIFYVSKIQGNSHQLQHSICVGTHEILEPLIEPPYLIYIVYSHLVAIDYSHLVAGFKHG